MQQACNDACKLTLDFDNSLAEKFLTIHSRALCLGADQKTRGPWERDCSVTKEQFSNCRVTFHIF